MSIYHVGLAIASPRSAAAREDWDRVHDGITDLAILVAVEAEVQVASAMEAIRDAYRAASAGLRRPELHSLLEARLGADMANRVLGTVREDLGELTPRELETRLLGIVL